MNIRDALGRSEDESLSLAACIGNRSTLQTLATAWGKSVDTTMQHLQQAVSDGLVEQQDEKVFTFYHDRVQEAAYGLIPESRREHIHYQIGSQLYAGVSEEELDEQIFEIVNHLNIGHALIRDSGEREGFC